jgi:hypothetical protein
MVLGLMPTSSAALRDRPACGHVGDGLVDVAAQAPTTNAATMARIAPLKSDE